MTTPPVALTIAGSDSGGGAGIQADLHAFAAHRVHGTSAITGLTAQNTEGVTLAHATSPEMLEAQLEAITSDFDVKAVKTGMLAGPELVDVVSSWAKAGKLPNLVVDPVMIATSGDTLFKGDVQAYREALVSVADVITPNLFEATELTGKDITTDSDLRPVAMDLADHGAGAVLIKGGHWDSPNVTDLLYVDGVFHELTLPRVFTKNLHGTGCTLAAAIAANLAHGLDIFAAVTAAKDYLTEAISAAANWELGAGSGPVDHHFRFNN